MDTNWCARLFVILKIWNNPIGISNLQRFWFGVGRVGEGGGGGGHPPKNKKKKIKFFLAPFVVGAFFFVEEEPFFKKH